MPRRCSICKYAITEYASIYYDLLCIQECNKELEALADSGRWPTFPLALSCIISHLFPDEDKDPKVTILIMYIALFTYFLQPRYQVTYEHLAKVDKW